NLFEISHRIRLGGSGAGFISEAPDGIYIVVLSQGLQELGRIACDEIDRSTRQVAGIEDLVEVRSNQRISLRWNCDDRIAGSQHRHDQRQKAEQWRVMRTNDADRSKRLIHGQRDIAEWRVVNCAVELVRPCRVGENALDTG